MGKITEIKLVGQPIFKQIMKLVDKVDIQWLIKKHESDYYYKSFKTRTQLFTILFGILSRGDSMTEICEGLRAMGGKLNHLDSRTFGLTFKEVLLIDSTTRLGSLERT